jgi:glycosyltransferase involved in cell wall biosynthesis
MLPEGPTTLGSGGQIGTVVLLSPLLPPAPGGAAQYTDLLSRSLVRHEVADRVLVFSERHPETADVEYLEGGRIEYRRTYPYRAGRAQRDYLSYFNYALQNIQFLDLPRQISRVGEAALIVHSSFHLHPSSINVVLRLMRRLFGPRLRLVVDVRDPKLPSGRLADLRIYDSIICCAQRIYDTIAAEPTLRSKAELIPIPFQPKALPESSIAACLQRFALERGGYFFFPNGLAREKGLDEVVSALRHLPADRRRPLVVAGRARDMDGIVK